jgi:hypothetical protein
VVAFADDDCWYPVDLLSRVDELLQANPGWDGGDRTRPRRTGQEAVSRWARKGGRVDRAHVWIQGVAVSMFLRRQVVENVGGVRRDARPGIGTPFGAGGETDYLLERSGPGSPSIRAGTYRLPPPEESGVHAATVSTGRSYGMAMGRGSARTATHGGPPPITPVARSAAPRSHLPTAILPRPGSTRPLGGVVHRAGLRGSQRAQRSPG